MSRRERAFVAAAVEIRTEKEKQERKKLRVRKK